MNKAEIANLFIKAAFIDSRLPISAGPKKLKSAWFTGAALTEEDQWRWIQREATDEGPSKLHKGDSPIKDWWLSFWDGRSVDTSRNDVRLWELANELMSLVANESNRRALWAWAAAKAGNLQADEVKTKRRSGVKLTSHKRTSRDVSFRAWCKAEGEIDTEGRRKSIHEMTGMRRKDRAIAVIEQHLVRGSSPNVVTAPFEVLPVGPVFEHISDMIGAVASDHKGPTFERDQDTVFAKEDALFNWREIRNADRRRKDAAKRRQQAA